MGDTYERPVLEIIELDAEDIIITSNGSEGPGIDEGEDEL